MTATELHATGKDRPALWFRLGRSFMVGLGFLGLLVLVSWASLAIYYSNLPWFSLRPTLAVAFAAFSIWALWMNCRPLMGLAFAGLLVAVVAWEASIAPSHDRPWRPDVAVMPRAIVDGDRVRLTGVRDFSYRSQHDFTVRHIEREVSLSDLISVDLFISYWAEGPVAHTFLSFNFDNAAPVSISIEARPEQGESFSLLPSLFKQFELIYVIGEERDIVGVRTTHRREVIYLYPVRATSAGVRRLFLIYMDRLNQLADRPEWYHLLKSNCTLNIVRYARAAGRETGFDLRYYLNGWVDRYLYEAGLLNTALPFDTLRARSRVHEIARADEGALDFSRRIRMSLPVDPTRGAAPRRNAPNADPDAAIQHESLVGRWQGRAGHCGSCP